MSTGPSFHSVQTLFFNQTSGYEQISWTGVRLCKVYYGCMEVIHMWCDKLLTSEDSFNLQFISIILLSAFLVSIKPQLCKRMPYAICFSRISAWWLASPQELKRLVISKRDAMAFFIVCTCSSPLICSAITKEHTISPAWSLYQGKSTVSSHKHLLLFGFWMLDKCAA